MILISDSVTYLNCKDDDFEATTMEDGTHRFTLKYQVGKNEKLTLTLNEAVVRRFGLESSPRFCPTARSGCAQTTRTTSASARGLTAAGTGSRASRRRARSPPSFRASITRRARRATRSAARAATSSSTITSSSACGSVQRSTWTFCAATIACSRQISACIWTCQTRCSSGTATAAWRWASIGLTTVSRSSQRSHGRNRRATRSASRESPSTRPRRHPPSEWHGIRMRRRFGTTACARPCGDCSRPSGRLFYCRLEMRHADNQAPRHRIRPVQVRKMGRADGRSELLSVGRARALASVPVVQDAETAQDELDGVRKGRQEPKLMKVPHSCLFCNEGRR